MSLSLKAAKRKQGRILIPNPSENGFNTLREKLAEWIEESELKENAYERSSFIL